jgi:transcriptional regulator GlxA family with amidase domain
MNTLAAACGLSLRQFERRFKQRIGIPPKIFARLLRFETLKSALIQDSARTLAWMASHSGYQDQAHAIHEFKLWAGCTPSAFLARVKQRTAQKPLHHRPRPAYTPIYIV